MRSGAGALPGGLTMERRDNYRIQAQHAKRYFLGYDQQKLIRKLELQADDRYLYVEMLCKLHRIDRGTGDIQKQEGENWVAADSHSEVMTLLDLVCDSREDRFISGRWKQMQAFGLMFHQNLLEDGADPFAQMLEKDPEGLVRACKALKGVPMDCGDISFAVELFDGLRVWLQFWAGDEEFPAKVRWLWDENALMYLKYETMYFAIGLLRQRIRELMGR